MLRFGKLYSVLFNIATCKQLSLWVFIPIIIFLKYIRCAHLQIICTCRIDNIHMPMTFIGKFHVLVTNLAGIYLFKVNNGNTRAMCEVCLNLTLKTQEWRKWRLSGVFVVNFKQISQIFLVFPLLTLNK